MVESKYGRTWQNMLGGEHRCYVDMGCQVCSAGEVHTECEEYTCEVHMEHERYIIYDV